MEITGINHVSLHVADLEASVNFYKHLGLTQKTRPNFHFRGAWFSIGEQHELHLIAGRDKKVNSGRRGNHFAITVSSIKETVEHLAQNGIPHRHPKQRPDGQWQVFLQDPDGYVIELTTEKDHP